MAQRKRFDSLARRVLRTQSDERLVALVRSGGVAAFEEIVRRYRPGLVAFAAAYVPAGEAEDVVQECFVRAWDALQRSTEEMHLKPWLYVIVRNRALNARRDARPVAPLSDEIQGSERPDDVLLGREELAAVVAAIHALPDAQREALVRSAVEGHTHEQIARGLDASPGAARQLIYRARTAVRAAAGAVIPLPVVKTLVDAGTETSGAAAAAGGATLAGLGGAGGGIAAKGAAVAAVAALATGAGIVVEKTTERNSEPRAAASEAREHDGSPSRRDDERGASDDGDRSGPSQSSGPSDDSGHDDDGDDGDSGHGGDDDRDDDDDRRDKRDDDDSSGPSVRSGPSGSSGSGSDRDDRDDLLDDFEDDRDDLEDAREDAGDDD